MKILLMYVRPAGAIAVLTAISLVMGAALFGGCQRVIEVFGPPEEITSRAPFVVDSVRMDITLDRTPGYLIARQHYNFQLDGHFDSSYGYLAGFDFTFFFGYDTNFRLTMPATDTRPFSPNEPIIVKHQSWGDSVFAVDTEGQVLTAFNVVLTDSLGSRTGEFSDTLVTNIRVGEFRADTPLEEGARQITAVAKSPVRPSFTPDGRWVYFWIPSDFLELWAVSPLGGRAEFLAEFGEALEVVASPSGKRVAMVRQSGDRHELWIVDTDGSNPNRVLSLSHKISDLAWSPADTAVAFALSEAGQQDLWYFQLLRPKIRRLSNTLAVERSPSWSPDGERILLRREQNGTGAIYLLNLRRDEPTRLVQDGEQPQWSPDGRRFAFVKDGDIFISGAAGTSIALLPRQLTTHPGPDGEPSWSPKGRYLVFVSHRRGEDQVWVIPSGT